MSTLEKQRAGDSTGRPPSQALVLAGRRRREKEATNWKKYRPGHKRTDTHPLAGSGHTHFVLQVSSGSASPTSFHVFSGEKVPDSFRGKRLHVVGKPQNQQGEDTVTLSGKRRNEALGDRRAGWRERKENTTQNKGFHRSEYFPKGPTNTMPARSLLSNTLSLSGSTFRITHS